MARGAAVAAVAAAGALGLLYGGERAAAADGALGVVDVQHAVMATEDGIRAQATLKKLFDKRQQDLDAKQTELQKARQDIERQSHVLSREALQKRMEDWQQGMPELQQVFPDYNNKELQGKAGRAHAAGIIKKMVTIIGKAAKKSSFELIVDKQAAPYSRPDLDLTEQVVQMYNGGDTGDPGGGDDKKDQKK